MLGNGRSTAAQGPLVGKFAWQPGAQRPRSLPTGAAMPKKPAAKPAAALACGNAACGKALVLPLLQCSKCKAEAYCCKACQVGDPACPRHALCAARAGARPCPLTHPHPFPLPVPPAARLPRGRPGTSTSAARWGRGAWRRRSCGALRGGVLRAQRPRARRRG